MMKRNGNGRKQRREPEPPETLADKAKRIIKETLMENVQRDGDPKSARLIAKMKDFNLLADSDGRGGVGSESCREEVRVALVDALVERIEKEHDPQAALLLGELSGIDLFVRRNVAPIGWQAVLNDPATERILAETKKFLPDETSPKEPVPRPANAAAKERDDAREHSA